MTHIEEEEEWIKDGFIALWWIVVVVASIYLIRRCCCRSLTQPLSGREGRGIVTRTTFSVPVQMVVIGNASSSCDPPPLFEDISLTGTEEDRPPAYESLYQQKQRIAETATTKPPVNSFTM